MQKAKKPPTPRCIGGIACIPSCPKPKNIRANTKLVIRASAQIAHQPTVLQETSPLEVTELAATTSGRGVGLVDGAEDGLVALIQRGGSVPVLLRSGREDVGVGVGGDLALLHDLGLGGGGSGGLVVDGGLLALARALALGLGLGSGGSGSLVDLLALRLLIQLLLGGRAGLVATPFCLKSVQTVLDQRVVDETYKFVFLDWR